MRNLIQVNLVAVVLSAVAAMVTGSIWYSKMAFGTSWMKLAGVSMNGDKSKMPLLYGSMFVGALLEAYMLSIFIHYAGAFTLINGLKTGLWVWLGFVGPVMLGNYTFGQRPMKLFYIDGGYALVNLLVMGAILATWF